jgi:hypothetical protein
MGKGCIVGLAGLGIIASIFLILATMAISNHNTAIGLETAIKAKQLDNTSEFDNMAKKISGVAQVSVKQMESLKEIFASHAQARNTGGKDQVMTWIKESIPNIDTKTFDNLQNIIVSSRDSWTMRQKELVDLSREHEKLLNLFPSGVILKMLGHKSIAIVIVTSTATEEAFKTGKDDNTKLF